MVYIYNITQSLQLSGCAREFLPELIQFGLDKTSCIPRFSAG